MVGGTWRAVLFDGESNGVLLELWGVKLVELGFRPAQGSSTDSGIQALPLAVLSSLTRPSTERATSFCREHCSMLHVATQVPPSFRVSCQDTCCRARHAEHRRRVGWPYVLTVERRRRFIYTKPHWPQTSRAAVWMPPLSWHASSLSCNWSFTFGASWN